MATESNQLSLTVVALVAVVAIVGLVALVLASRDIATGAQIASATTPVPGLPLTDDAPGLPAIENEAGQGFRTFQDRSY